MTQPAPKPVELAVRVTPRAANNQIIGESGGVWKIRLSEPPVEGKANQALVKYLADKLEVNRSQVVLLKGATCRNKIVSIYGISLREVNDRLRG